MSHEDGMPHFRLMLNTFSNLVIGFDLTLSVTVSLSDRKVICIRKELAMLDFQTKLQRQRNP